MSKFFSALFFLGDSVAGFSVSALGNSEVDVIRTDIIECSGFRGFTKVRASVSELGDVTLTTINHDRPIDYISVRKTVKIEVTAIVKPLAKVIFW